MNKTPDLSLHHGAACLEADVGDDVDAQHGLVVLVGGLEDDLVLPARPRTHNSQSLKAHTMLPRGRDGGDLLHNLQALVALGRGALEGLGPRAQVASVAEHLDACTQGW